MGAPGRCARAVIAARRPSSVWVGGIRTSTTDTSGRCLSTASTRAGPSPTNGYHLVTVLGEQADQALTQQHRVVGHHDPQRHGTSAVIVVGPPSGLVIRSLPP